jgi:hypothetical protein
MFFINLPRKTTRCQDETWHYLASVTMLSGTRLEQKAREMHTKDNKAGNGRGGGGQATLLSCVKCFVIREMEHTLH